MSIASTKAVQTLRVDTASASRAFSRERYSGDPKTCLGGQNLKYDQFGRYVHHDTLSQPPTAECSHFYPNNQMARLRIENHERPYYAMTGSVRAGDHLIGAHRNAIPGGGFVKTETSLKKITPSMHRYEKL